MGNNKYNIDIRPSIRLIPTTHKVVVNAILNSGIYNDGNGSRSPFMGKGYGAPQFFSMMENLGIYMHW